MRALSELETRIYNEGERLIPGATHDHLEVRRHYASYLFFREVIERDLAARGPGGPPLRIVDLGAGTGHGCATLAAARGVEVVGVDISADCLAYARERHAAPNLSFVQRDLVAFVQEMPEFDYVVSRGVLEHIENGLALALRARWTRRLLFDVPYDEPYDVNQHHVVSSIREQHFDAFPRAEIFFEDLDGVLFDRARKPPRPNMILCACRAPDLPAIASQGFVFPLERRWTQPEAQPPPGPPPPAPPSVSARARARLRRWLGARRASPGAAGPKP